MPLGAYLMVEDGQVVKKEDTVFTWDPYSNPIIADIEGTVRFVDLVEDESLSEELGDSFEYNRSGQLRFILKAEDVAIAKRLAGQLLLALADHRPDRVDRRM